MNPPNPTKEDVFAAELNNEMAKRTDKLNDATIEIALRVKQAREFIAWSAHHVRGSWLEWSAEADKASKDINLFRMSFDRETKSMIGAGKDMRDFFNSIDFLTAKKHLEETVYLLDKFTQLRNSGALDALADFILKVTTK